MHTHWLCIQHFPDSIGSADPRQVFDDACDDMAEAMEKWGCDRAEVYRMDFDDGRLVDVTDEAERRVAQWHHARRQPLPEWLHRCIAAE